MEISMNGPTYFRLLSIFEKLSCAFNPPFTTYNTTAVDGRKKVKTMKCLNGNFEVSSNNTDSCETAHSEHCLHF